MSRLQEAARRIKRDALTVYFAARDPRTPLPVRLLALMIAAYAFSPIDLIPDFIPVLGYLDDLILLPLGILLVIRLTPEVVIADSRAKAQLAADRPVSPAAAVVIVLIWLLCAAGLGYWWLAA
ncbi:uncharacterized membrane protein YkvA (DUF1232 family) [Fluviicoccus keumensis]|uniref:Uncharacterized membrane protein YkvA (DUF1232 family) n=1 Tax=Fluviicoccus keumensis TaxID=1435465 RepID=A0A4Q7YPB2_9GAMM|nr:uncharacterized membrane protein YkvA (DUF1232 family) [Fluviicoccus keumensis]